MRYTLGVRCICILSYLLASDRVRAETLEDALSSAYRNNPGLMGTRAVAQAAAQGVVRARSAYGPTIEANVQYEYTDAQFRGYTTPSREAGFATAAELSLSQPLFSSGRLASQVDVATANKMAAEARLDQSSQQLIADVVSAYTSLKRDIELYEVAIEIHKLLRRQRDETVARYRLRDTTAPDVDQTVNRVELAAGRVIASRADVETSAARYRNLVGHYPDSLQALPRMPDLPTLEILYTEAEANSPSLAISKFTEIGSRAAVATARAEMLPQVNAFAAASRDPISPGENLIWREAVSVGLRVSMSLYTGGQQSSSLRVAKERNLADQQFVEQARRDMREKLAADWALLEAAQRSLPRFASAVEAAERAVEGVKRQEVAGIRTLRDVLDVTNDLLTARTAMTEVNAQIYILQITVLRDAGLLGSTIFSNNYAEKSESMSQKNNMRSMLSLGAFINLIDGMAVNENVEIISNQLDGGGDLDFFKKFPLHPDLDEKNNDAYERR